MRRTALMIFLALTFVAIGAALRNYLPTWYTFTAGAVLGAGLALALLKVSEE